ncbi:MAG: ThiF family adenylyltransferase, partial [Bdellovibrionales bacterium]
MNHYFIYLLTSYNHKPLYTGFTNNLERRMYEHKNEIFEGYTKKYNCKKLVYFEVFENSEAAILREKEIKGWVRKRKDELIDKHNPDWKDLTETWNQDPSAQALQDDIFLSRYTRQLALPDISMADQKRLKETHIAVIGAGGLGGAALPYLAAAGIGRITIIDHDTVSRSNLHRQTIYKDAQTGQSKADLAAAYCRDLNPDIDVTAINKKLCHPERSAQREVEGSRNKKDLSTADAIAPFAQDDNILI